MRAANGEKGQLLAHRSCLRTLLISKKCVRAICVIGDPLHPVCATGSVVQVSGLAHVSIPPVWEMMRLGTNQQQWRPCSFQHSQCGAAGGWAPVAVSVMCAYATAHLQSKTVVAVSACQVVLAERRPFTSHTPDHLSRRPAGSHCRCIVVVRRSVPLRPSIVRSQKTSGNTSRASKLYFASTLLARHTGD
jgi:hypothetical protein